MEKLVSAYGAVYDHPGKGHDRLYINEEQAFFGVFDGAGGDELSQAIVDNLPTIIAKHSPTRVQSQDLFMADICYDLDNLSEGALRMSTGALACVMWRRNALERRDMINITCANMGDSSLYCLFSPDDKLRPIQHTETSYVQVNGQRLVDTAEFFGSRRTSDDISYNTIELFMQPSDRWSIIGMTDGVKDDDGRGISADELDNIVHHTKAKNVSKKILNNFEPYDDASVFIIQR